MRIYWLHCLSPTHAGIGRGLGYIDLPIDRDLVTGWPIIRASGFKGVWADYFRATEDNRRRDPYLKAAFGTAGENNLSNAGALVPSDARLVCLPVRSFRGTFAWASSPMSLQLLHRTLSLAGITNLPAPPAQLDENKAHHTQETVLKEDQKIYFEDLDFTAVNCETATAWAAKIAAWVFPTDKDWQQQFHRRFVVLPDAAFDYMCETGTEVHTRVRIDDTTKTVAQGALWTEESLPAETILMGVIQCDRVFGGNGTDITPAGLLDKFAKGTLILQIGGKATVGRGQVRCVFTEVAS
ncbi:MAG: type III-B CRISPR module RAMP protein Cmr4 [Thermogemmata sp.]|nr:type III-B CRISPR module RAMP protein Cmr4 [Thermogemmata sp.]